MSWHPLPGWSRRRACYGRCGEREARCGAQRGLGAPQGASRRGGRPRHGACAAPLALAPAEPAPPSPRSAPLTAYASHRNVHHAL
ncbi:hypothetical protein CKY51_05380 [Xanthomonas maliensis]|nr:hypothetical protein CKY51_05380 [Xanthomonas maliensis]